MNDNKLIAEFMGLVVSDSANYTSELHTNVDADLKYHTEWNWLMPVVIKCKESVDYCNEDNALKYHNIEDEMLSQLSIEDTYNAVVEFIKEHNDDTI